MKPRTPLSQNYPSNVTQELRKLAKSLFTSAVRAADPAVAMRRHFENHPLPVSSEGRNYLISVGKAAVPMTREALRHMNKKTETLVVTNPENQSTIEGAKVIVSSHPVPSAASVAAGQKVLEVLQRANKQDNITVLISGGGSSLMVAPEGKISISDYARTNQMLLESGLGIEQMNLVRQHIDKLKGGGMARLASPACVQGYILSDVIGDDLRSVASGPTVAPLGTAQDAIELLHNAGLWDCVPQTVRATLSEDKNWSKPPRATNHLIGSNSQSLEAVIADVPVEFNARIASNALVGDVQEAASKIVAEASEALGPTVLVFGGETTVQLRGKGLGGRNQELALRVAEGADEALPPGWVFLSCGTDGRDGPTDSAGGLVDSTTLQRIKDANGNLNSMLENNDSYNALTLSGDHVFTGGTGTNVADVQIFILPAE